MSTQRYLVTARKYRPQQFHELVAQEHVTETLKNALRLDRLAHAYLFSGPRGVGKTTAARILAKAINCTTPEADRQDAAEPCRQCDSCRSFEEGRNLNIIEIDAASNNKVEDIRDLRETVRVPPQGGRKKVYIVDEVHMLSNAAFNALLKTLEEPPPHVLFIFATTEPHKVLPTILSRCQRFDFRRIPVPEIVTHLRGICQEEHIQADEASLMLVARKGDGALRDALSAFDQAVSLCGTHLTYAELAQALGVVDVDLFFDVTRHVAARDSAGLLRLVQRIVAAGYDLQEFLVGLAEHLRNLLVARTLADTALIEAAEAVRARYAEAAEAFEEADLLRLLTTAAEAEEAVKSSTQPRLKLEMALLRMAGQHRALDLRTALQQIERLEALARDGKLPQTLPAAPQPPAPARADAPAPARADAPAPARAEAPRAETPAPADRAPSVREDEAAYTPAPRSTTPPPVQEPEEASAAFHAAAPPPTAAPQPDVAPKDLQKEAPKAAQAADAQEDPPAPVPPAAPSLFGTPALKKKTLRVVPRDETPEPPAAIGDSADAGNAVTAEAPVLSVQSSPALRRARAAWKDLVATIKADRIHVGSLLQHTEPHALQADALVLRVPDDFHRRLLGSQEAFILEHVRAVLGEHLAHVRFEVDEAVEVQATPQESAHFNPAEYMQQKREENPVVQAIFEQFGGELVW